MRIYYCGHVPNSDAISRLAALAGGTKSERCGATAYNKCTCGAVHPDEMNADYYRKGGGKLADHPRYLCNECLELYEE